MRWDKLKKTLATISGIQWRKRWLKDNKGRDIARLRPFPTKRALHLYSNRAKATSSIILQLRSGKIGLNSFLYKRRVPGIDSENCLYCEEQVEESVKHFLLECNNWNEQRDRHLGRYKGYRDLRSILNSREGSLRAAKYLVATGRLEQFQSVDLTNLK
jgi:hypothetical protein